jgi:amidase
MFRTLRHFSFVDITRRSGSLIRTTADSLKTQAEELGLTLSETEVAVTTRFVNASMEAIEDLHALPDNVPRVKYPRTPGYEPSLEENKYGAWYFKTDIKGADSGKLLGKRVAIKDNVAVAGVPMMNGCEILEGYMPEFDATVVTRLLDAGAVIAGKSHCESFCLSGGSHTCDKGPVINPKKSSYSSGGSSSGSAVLVSTGEVDMAIACDQGGSIRIPASFCGVVGMKPTFGLVPYTGIFPIEPTLDHCGPITANVRDNALMLEVIAGPDGLDHRQMNLPSTFDYTSTLESGLKGMRIGVVNEGFVNCEKSVEAKVREAIATLKQLGGIVEEVSIPWHLKGMTLITPILAQGMTQVMLRGYGFGFGFRGQYMPSLSAQLTKVLHQPDQLSSTLKAFWLLGEHLETHYGSKFYGKAQNLSMVLRQAYDSQLSNYDLLLMPTLPIRAKPLPDKSAAEVIDRAFDMISNTAAFDLTGHPALTVPCGSYSDLPVGLMFVGKHFQEGLLYRAALAYEQGKS